MPCHDALSLTTSSPPRPVVGVITVVCDVSSKAYVRKKAVLVLYKMFLQFPQGLRLSFDALKRRLSDEDTSVRPRPAVASAPSRRRCRQRVFLCVCVCVHLSLKGRRWACIDHVPLSVFLRPRRDVWAALPHRWCRAP